MATPVAAAAVDVVSAETADNRGGGGVVVAVRDTTAVVASCGTAARTAIAGITVVVVLVVIAVIVVGSVVVGVGESAQFANLLVAICVIVVAFDATRQHLLLHCSSSLHKFRFFRRVADAFTVLCIV